MTREEGIEEPFTLSL